MTVNESYFESLMDSMLKITDDYEYLINQLNCIAGFEDCIPEGYKRLYNYLLATISSDNDILQSYLK